MSDLGLPPDDPAPGLEAEIGPDGVTMRSVAEPEAVDLTPGEINALRRGLALLGGPEAEALSGRLPIPAESADDAAPPAEEVQRGTTKVLLRVSPALGSWFLSHQDIVPVERQPDRSVVVSLPVSTTDGLLPWMLRLGPGAQVVEPRSLRFDLAAGADELASRYRMEAPEVT